VVLKPETIRGVGSFYVNLILDIIFGAFALVVGTSSILAASTTGSAAAIAVLAATGAATCGLVIVFVINFIVSLMSVFHMHHGVDEYGPMKYALSLQMGTRQFYQRPPNSDVTDEQKAKIKRALEELNK